MRHGLRVIWYECVLRHFMNISYSKINYISTFSCGVLRSDIIMQHGIFLLLFLYKTLSNMRHKQQILPTLLTLVNITIRLFLSFYFFFFRVTLFITLHRTLSVDFLIRTQVLMKMFSGQLWSMEYFSFFFFYITLSKSEC